MVVRGLLSLVPVMLGVLIAHILVQNPTLGPPSTNPVCANPPMDQCTFYADCLEPRYHCGSDGYPIGDGQYYCQKFSDDRAMFDVPGQQWMIDTMHCLQLALVGDAIDATPNATACQALKDQAFASHPRCWVSNGFCTLGVQDWAAVLAIVNITTVFSNWDAFKATVETAGDCGGFYAYMVTKGLF